MNRRQRTWLALSLLPQIVLVKWIGHHPEWVERYYSEGLYPHISQFLRWLFGWIPFSMGDVFYTLLGVAAIRYLYLYGRQLWQRPLNFMTDLGCVLALAYAIFHLSWGMNYYRLPLEEKLGISKEYKLTELVQFTDYLIDRSNQSQLALTQDSTEAVNIPYSKAAVFKMTIAGYKELAHELPAFAYARPSLKKSLYSLPLTYMGYGGYLNPFSGEAQVNGTIPILRYPTVSGHEVGHQIGYSSESDTNFIGFLVTASHQDPYFKYAAYSHALAYCLSDLKSMDERQFASLWKKVNPGIKANYKELQRFWEQYENPTEPIFEAVFNAFLKANNQADGIQSYNKVVGLLLNYHKHHGF